MAVKPTVAAGSVPMERPVLAPPPATFSFGLEETKMSCAHALSAGDSSFSSGFGAGTTAARESGGGSDGGGGGVGLFSFATPAGPPDVSLMSKPFLSAPPTTASPSAAPPKGLGGGGGLFSFSTPVGAPDVGAFAVRVALGSAGGGAPSSWGAAAGGLFSFSKPIGAPSLDALGSGGLGGQRETKKDSSTGDAQTGCKQNAGMKTCKTVEMRGAACGGAGAESVAGDTSLGCERVHGRRTRCGWQAVAPRTGWGSCRVGFGARWWAGRPSCLSSALPTTSVSIGTIRRVAFAHAQISSCQRVS